MKKGFATICLILAIIFALGTIGCLDTDPAAACFGAVCTVLLFLAWMKLRKKKKAATPTKAAPAKPAETPAPAPTVPTGPQYEHIHIKVAGVTFSNDDGMDRQQLLRKIKYGKAPFEDNDNLDVALKVQTFTNSDDIEEPAVGVYVNEYQIGFVPKDLIKDVMYALDQPTATITAIDISGGGTHNGTKYPYGCKVVIRYEK